MNPREFEGIPENTNYISCIVSPIKTAERAGAVIRKSGGSPEL